jgi:hypothetical protein
MNNEHLVNARGPSPNASHEINIFKVSFEFRSFASAALKPNAA